LHAAFQGHLKSGGLASGHRELPISFVIVDEDFIYKAVQLRAGHGMSRGDCFAAALAVEWL